MMNVYTCNDHDGHWPVGTASVVVAKDEAEARDLLRRVLKDQGLNPNEPFTLKLLETTAPVVRVLCDGDY